MSRRFNASDFSVQLLIPADKKFDFFDICLNHSSVYATEPENAFSHSVHKRSFCGTEHV
jgi:hypothetical protein